MQCMENLGCFSQAGNGSSLSTVLPSFFLLFPHVCAMFCCFHTTGCEAYSFMSDGYGIFNMRTNVGACLTHEGKLTQLNGWIWSLSISPNKLTVHHSFIPQAHDNRIFFSGQMLWKSVVFPRYPPIITQTLNWIVLCARWRKSVRVSATPAKCSVSLWSKDQHVRPQSSTGEPFVASARLDFCLAAYCSFGK